MFFNHQKIQNAENACSYSKEGDLLIIRLSIKVTLRIQKNSYNCLLKNANFLVKTSNEQITSYIIK